MKFFDRGKGERIGCPRKSFLGFGRLSQRNEIIESNSFQVCPRGHCVHSSEENFDHAFERKLCPRASVIVFFRIDLKKTIKLHERKNFKVLSKILFYRAPSRVLKFSNKRQLSLIFHASGWFRGPRTPNLVENGQKSEKSIVHSLKK